MTRADKADIWFPVYIGDYMADTAHLSTEQHGAYLLLMFAYWKRGRPLPDDDGMLARIARLDADAWSIHRAVLADFFCVEDGQWRHGRIDAELASAQDRKAKRQAKAKKAAKARWGAASSDEAHAGEAPGKAKGEPPAGCSEHSPSIPQAMPEECPSSSSSPSDSLRSSDSASRDARAESVVQLRMSRGEADEPAPPMTFDEFWNGCDGYGGWPNKVSKQPAIKAWAKLTRAQIARVRADLVDARRVERDPQWRRWIVTDDFALHATTYLNQSRFEDEWKPMEARHDGAQAHQRGPGGSRIPARERVRQRSAERIQQRRGMGGE